MRKRIASASTVVRKYTCSRSRCKHYSNFLFKLDGIPSKARVGLFLLGSEKIRRIPLRIFIGRFGEGAQLERSVMKRECNGKGSQWRGSAVGKERNE